MYAVSLGSFVSCDQHEKSSASLQLCRSCEFSDLGCHSRATSLRRIPVVMGWAACQATGIYSHMLEVTVMILKLNKFVTRWVASWFWSLAPMQSHSRRAPQDCDQQWLSSLCQKTRFQPALGSRLRSAPLVPQPEFSGNAAHCLGGGCRAGAAAAVAALLCSQSGRLLAVRWVHRAATEEKCNFCLTSSSGWTPPLHGWVSERWSAEITQLPALGFVVLAFGVGTKIRIAVFPRFWSVPSASCKLHFQELLQSREGEAAATVCRKGLVTVQ